MKINEYNKIDSPNLSYCKSPDYTGCFKKCPCRTWINCLYYNEYKRKINKDEFFEEIYEYYNIYFREHFNVQGEATNG